MLHLIDNEHVSLSLNPILSFAVAIFATGQLAAQSPSPAMLVKAGRLLDPRSGNVVSPAAVLIENGKIKEVGPAAKVQAHASGNVKNSRSRAARRCLPGLIDGHTHLFLDIIVPPEAEAQRHENGIFAPGLLLAIVESPTKRALMGAQLAREDLESGITTRSQSGSLWY